MIPRWTYAVAVILLGAVHLILGLMPEPLLSLASNLVLFATNLYVLWCGFQVMQNHSQTRLGLFVLGYLILFLLLVVLLQRESLFVLLIIVYASVFRNGLLLGLFALFVLSYVVFQPYAFETFAPLAFAYWVIWRIWRAGASRFKVACLSLGLGVLALVLLPIVHLMIQDSPQTLWYQISRPEVQQALWLSLLSSALTTLIVAAWGIPLAYALARTEFRGKSLVESLVDLPIFIPQSVVGIALLALLGPASPLGETLEGWGLTVSGRFAGIVIAQVFVSCPFLIKAAMTAFEGVPEHLENVSRTLGAGPRKTFFGVSLPLASRGIVVGLILCWARAISEFGAILLFARHPLTAPVLVDSEFNKAGIAESRPVAVLLLLMCLWIFVLLQFGRTLLPRAHRRSEIGSVRR